MTTLGTQPCGEIAQVPQLAQRQAELEQAMMMQGQHRHWPCTLRRGPRWIALDGVVVRGDRGDAGIGDPLQQAFVAAVQRAAAMVQHLGIGLAGHLHHHLGKPGAQHKDVAGFDHDAIGLDHAHQVVVSDRAALAPVMRGQVDQHATRLDTVRGEGLDAERVGVAVVMAARVRGEMVAFRVVDRADDVGIGAKAVVVDPLGHAVAIGIEQRADVGQGIPLRRVLHRQQYLVVAQDIKRVWVDLGQRKVDVRHVVTERGSQHRRMPAWIENIAARQIERQRQAERLAAADFAGGGTHALRGNQVQAAELVVITEVAPVGAFGPLLPSFHG